MYLHTIFGKNNTAISLNAVISKVESGSHSAPKGAVTTGAPYSEMISLCLDRYRSRSLIPISLTMAFIYRLGLLVDIILTGSNITATTIMTPNTGQFSKIRLVSQCQYSILHVFRQSLHS